MAEDARRCTQCEYKWFAKRVSKPAKTYGAGAGWAALGSTGMAAGAGAKAGAHYATKLERHERWRNCPRCGSRKVQTERKRRFVPTAAEESAARQPTPPTQKHQTNSAPPRSDAPAAAAATPTDQPDASDGYHDPWLRRIGLALLCIVLGPISRIYGGEALRRTGRGAGDLINDSEGRRPLLTAIGGALGTAALGGAIAQGIALLAGATPPANGEFEVYTAVGFFLGSMIAGLLIVAIRCERFSRLQLPNALHAP